MTGIKVRACILKEAARETGEAKPKKENKMLWTIIVILLVLWAIGFVAGAESIGGLIHILLAIAAVVLVIQLLKGRRPV